MIRFFLWCLRVAVVVILTGVALLMMLGGRRDPVELEGAIERSGKGPRASEIGTNSELARREAMSKKKLVSSVPELGVSGHALREEFDRRARLFRSVNPRFFDSPEWPEQLWRLMARDLSLEERGVVYPWKSDGMGSARP